MLEFAGISKNFMVDGAAIRALRPVDLTVERGSFTALLGPSGCGKTTLLKLVAGLLEPSSGSISWDGTPAPIAPARIGMVFQQHALLPWRTVLQNVMLPAQVLGIDKELARERANALLKTVGLSGAEKKHPDQLSGGMQQRVGIVRALVHDPEILLMDEPFASLDALTRENLGKMLEDLLIEFDKTVLFVTHSIAEAALLADKIAVFSPSPGGIVDLFNVPVPRPRDITDPDVAERLALIEAKARKLMVDDRQAVLQ